MEKKERTKNDDKEGLSLLDKGKKGVIHMIFSRFGIILLLLALQIVVLFAIFGWFRRYAPHYLGIAILFSLIMVVVLINSEHDATSKITWLIAMELLPIFGSLLYIYTNIDVGHRALKKRTANVMEETRQLLVQKKDSIDAVKQNCPELADLVHYVNRTGSFPVYSDADVSYFPSGEQMFDSMLEELRNAKDFIFMEYFILDEGMMWGRILEILVQKAKEGVEVRVMYDGTCEFALLPRSYPKQLEELGIHCKVFAPILPFISTHYNYRDHRKILVIDGKTAFNGGINLADEYINHVQRYGYWKDTGVMIRGEAVANFTLMFLQMWHTTEKLTDISHYVKASETPALPDNPDRTKAEPQQNMPVHKGFVMPYGECPLDNDNVAENVYMDILNRAHHYVHITTPYLILDGELEKCIKFAAERGVEVKLILPHVSDSFVAHSLAKTYYKSLLDSGVEIYEYTPGFVHAKIFVSDDKRAVVGTINLDYRSLYHHFECATYLYETDCIPDIEADVQHTLESCQLVTYETIKQEKWYVKFVGNVMKIIAPLL